LRDSQAAYSQRPARDNLEVALEPLAISDDEDTETEFASDSGDE